MDFTFTPEQEALRQVTRAFLTAEAPGSYVRAMVDDERGFTDDLWAKTVALGWPGLLVAATHGGAGLGMLEAVVLCEEMGALPLPGPWLSSAVAGGLVAHHLDDGDVLPRLADGSRRATIAVEETGARDPLDGVATTARRRGDRWLLDGLKPLVIDGHTADLAYVVARDGDGLAAFALDQPAGTLVPNLDVTRKVARLELDGRPARRVGPAGDQRHVLARVVDDIGVALCAESVGACERALRMATEYAKQRVQFDRPIATFQVIKHKIVDMLHQLELARVATHYAAWASAVDDPQRESAAALAKGFVAEAAVMITGDNIQVHGGVGFTWDLDCHLLFRRVKANDVLFGRQGWQRQRLADLVLGPRVTVIEVFAELGCPFTHVGLRRLVERRRAAGRDDLVLRVRAWPLELVNGSPLDPLLIAEEVDELRRQVAPDLFAGFDPTSSPASSLPGLDLAAAAHALGSEAGERVSLLLRERLFEEGRPIADPDVLREIASACGLPIPGDEARARVLADWHEGQARGVIGSPHFFVGDGDWFCPSLDIQRIDGRLVIRSDPPAFEAFVERCLSA